jgi:glycosyltransferase involved in cell wall biosynthesis
MTSSNAPFFTVIVPVHNKAPHVSRSIGSVLGQSYGNFELLVIDDASTDGSLQKSRNSAIPDPRVAREILELVDMPRGISGATRKSSADRFSGC